MKIFLYPTRHYMRPKNSSRINIRTNILPIFHIIRFRNNNKSLDLLTFQVGWLVWDITLEIHLNRKTWI